MKIDDIVIVANLGEMKIYQAKPRDLEAEAGLKPDHIKLDLINAIDYVESHWNLKDVVTDEAGRFKADAGKMGGNIGERHELEKRLQQEVIEALAHDIAKTVHEINPPKYFLALPENIFNEVWSEVEALASKYPEVKSKLFRFIKEDLTKTDKNELPKIFKEKGKHF